MDLEDDLLLDVASGDNGEFVMSRYSASVRVYTSAVDEKMLTVFQASHAWLSSHKITLDSTESLAVETGQYSQTLSEINSTTTPLANHSRLEDVLPSVEKLRKRGEDGGIEDD